MNFSMPDFDVGIIGGGPAGSSMAAYLAKAGVNCVVFERDLMPRAHVGESLVPSSTRVFRDLDFCPRWKNRDFPRNSAQPGRQLMAEALTTTILTGS